MLIVHLEISAYTANTGYKGKKEEDMFSKGYIHLVQPICIRAQIATHQNFCPQIMFYRTNSMYWDREVSANSADQDQTASEEAV